MRRNARTAALLYVTDLIEQNSQKAIQKSR